LVYHCILPPLPDMRLGELVTVDCDRHIGCWKTQQGVAIQATRRRRVAGKDSNGIGRDRERGRRQLSVHPSVHRLPLGILYIHHLAATPRTPDLLISCLKTIHHPHHLHGTAKHRARRSPSEGPAWTRGNGDIRQARSDYNLGRTFQTGQISLNNPQSTPKR
jgi:hypothetical protein